MAVTVEERDAGTIVVHGSLGGLVAGLALGATAIVSTVALGGGVSLPFRFVAAVAAGADAFSPDFPVGAAVLLGGTIHLTLASVVGVLFVGTLALTYQLSARAWLLVAYGSAFAFAVWEVNFLAAIPALLPELVGRLDLATQLWNGVVSYVLVYGPALGLYVAVVRPGVIDDWRGLRPPATSFRPPTPDGRR